MMSYSQSKRYCTGSKIASVQSLTQAAASHVEGMVSRRRRRKSPHNSTGFRFLSALAQLLRTEKIRVRTLEDLRRDPKESSAADLDVHDPDLCGYCGTFACCVYLKIRLKQKKRTYETTVSKNSSQNQNPPLFPYWHFGANETELLIHESIHAVRIHLSKDVSPELFAELQGWSFGTSNDPLYHTIEAREEWIAYTLSWYIQQFPVKRSLDSFSLGAIQWIASIAQSSNSLYSGITDDLLQQTQTKLNMRTLVEQTLMIAENFGTVSLDSKKL